MECNYLGNSYNGNSISEALDNLYKNVYQAHSHTFGQLKREFKDREIVLLGGGPSVSIFNHIENAIYIGLNAMVFHPMRLDYICFQDNQRGIVTRAVERQDSSRILCGENIFCHFNKIPVEATFNNALKFYTAYISTATYPKWRVNILEEPLDFFSSTTFAILQVLLWCEPKKIYLVGFDCNGAGGLLGHSSLRNYAQILPVWRAFKKFAKTNYPNIGISVVNPMGLKGVFTDLYQDEPGIAALDMLAEKDHARIRKYIYKTENINNPGIKSLILKLWNERGSYREAFGEAGEWYSRTGDPGFRAFQELALSVDDCGHAMEVGKRVLHEHPAIFFTHAHLAIKLWQEYNDTSWIKLVRSLKTSNLRHYWGMAMWSAFFYYRDAGMPEKAIACGRENLALSPQGNAIKKDLFIYFMARKDYRAASTLARECAEYNRDWPECQYMAAMLAKVDNRKKEAIHLLHRAVEMAPLLFIYRIRLAELLRYYGDFDQAHAIINEGLCASPTWHDGYYQRAQNYLAANNITAAAENTQMAINLMPVEMSPFRPYREALAYLLVAVGAADKAENFVRETLEIVPEWGMGWKLLSEIYEKSK